ncbi:TPA: 4Fe-4S ferredoxin, partial [bacterium]|nr:4Fe-4S ferredoxin [bacterium]
AYWSDSLIVLTHFKGHGLTGFGGTIKNVGMGLTDKIGKCKMHTDTGPIVEEERCQGCGLCLKWCASEAINLYNEVVKIDQAKCVGCGQCLVSCSNKAIRIDWNAVSSRVVQERICEAALAVLKERKALFLNFLMDVTPDCDCCPHSDAPIVPDIGILASRDPVAIDQAGVDLVNSTAGLKDTALKINLESGEDKFRGLHPQVSWEIQLEYAEAIGLGSREYELIALRENVV